MNDTYADINIDKLRDIGWTLWDPLGLLSVHEDWHGTSSADEYDRYLYAALQVLRNGQSVEDVVDYLFLIQSQYMGLGPVKMNDRLRAKLEKVASALGDLA